MKPLYLTQEEKMQHIAATPPFGCLDRMALKTLAITCRAWDCRPGDVLIPQGDPGSRIFSVMEIGLCQALGNEMDLIAYRGPRAAFGQHCALTNIPHRHTTRVVMPSHILELDKETYLRIAHQSNPLLLGLMTVLQEESDVQAYFRETMTKATARGKVAAVLLQIILAYSYDKLIGTDVEHVYQRDEYEAKMKWLDILNQSTPLELRWLTQSELALCTGLNLRTVRREIRGLMEDGAINFANRASIVICDAHSLVGHDKV